jgi:hypothetical protein
MKSTPSAVTNGDDSRNRFISWPRLVSSTRSSEAGRQSSSSQSATKDRSGKMNRHFAERDFCLIDQQTMDREEATAKSADA